MGYAVDIEAPDLSRFERFFITFPKFFDSPLKRWEEGWAKETAVRIRAKAPVETGEYRDTIVAIGTSVVSSHPAARRLELGFIGTDSLGRHYAQMPDPHWTPAIEEVVVEMAQELGGLTLREMKSHMKGM